MIAGPLSSIPLIHSTSLSPSITLLPFNTNPHRNASLSHASLIHSTSLSLSISIPIRQHCPHRCASLSSSSNPFSIIHTFISSRLSIFHFQSPFSQPNNHSSRVICHYASAGATYVYRIILGACLKTEPFCFSLSLSLHFSQHLFASFPFSLSISLSFTHFYLSPISYTCFRSPFSIHYNHSLFYSQATHKSNTHHEHHSIPVIRFHQRETAQQRETPSLHFAFSFFLSFYSTHVSTRSLTSTYLLFLSSLVALPHTVLACSILHPHCGSTSTALHCNAFSHFIQPVSEQSVMAKKGRKQSILKSKEHDAKKEGGRH